MRYEAPEQQKIIGIEDMKESGIKNRQMAETGKKSTEDKSKQEKRPVTQRDAVKSIEKDMKSKQQKSKHEEKENNKT